MRSASAHASVLITVLAAVPVLQPVTSRRQCLAMQQHGTTALDCPQGRTVQLLVQLTSLVIQQARRLLFASLMETLLFQDSAALPQLVSTLSMTAGHVHKHVSTLLAATASSCMEGLHVELGACAALQAHARTPAHSIPACPAHADQVARRRTVSTYACLQAAPQLPC